MVCVCPRGEHAWASTLGSPPGPPVPHVGVSVSRSSRRCPCFGTRPTGRAASPGRTLPGGFNDVPTALVQLAPWGPTATRLGRRPAGPRVCGAVGHTEAWAPVGLTVPRSLSLRLL